MYDRDTMLLVSSRGAQATHVPVMMPLVTLLVVLGGVSGLMRGAYWMGVGGTALGALVAFVTLQQFRRLSATASELRVATLFGTTRLVLAEVAFGIRVHRSARGHSTYTVYAKDARAQADLCEVSREKSAERCRDRLQQALLRDRVSDEGAAASEAEVARREQRWRAADAEAQRQVNAYYASGAFKRVGVWVACIVLVYSVGMVLYFQFAQ